MKKALYLGTDPSCFVHNKPLIHYPIIRLIPKSSQDLEVQRALMQLSSYFLCLFTSKNAVHILFSLAKELSLSPGELLAGKCVSIGPSTTKALKEHGVDSTLEAFPNTQEGMIDLLKEISLEKQAVFYPRSSLARPLLSSYLIEALATSYVLDLYDTEIQPQGEPPSLENIEEIIFTSPSTVEGFFSLFSEFPSGIRPVFQGPITEKAFYRRINKK